MTCFEFWSLLISALGAAGTIGAVITALYLASSKNKVKLIGMAYKGAQILGDGSEPNECAIFKIINKSNRPIKITNIGWKLGKPDKKAKYAIINLSATSINFGKNVPVIINEGDDETFLFEWDKCIDGLKSIVGDVKELEMIKGKKNIWFLVHEATNLKAFEFKPDHNFIDEL